MLPSHIDVSLSQINNIHNWEFLKKTCFLPAFQKPEIWHLYPRVSAYSSSENNFPPPCTLCFLLVGPEGPQGTTCLRLSACFPHVPNPFHLRLVFALKHMLHGFYIHKHTHLCSYYLLSWYVKHTGISMAQYSFSCSRPSKNTTGFLTWCHVPRVKWGRRPSCTRDFIMTTFTKRQYQSVPNVQC